LLTSCRDLHPRDFDCLAASDDSLGGRTRESGAYEFDHLLDREAVREHHRFGAAVAAGGEQFERAAAAGATDLYYAQAPAVLYHSRTLLQGDGDAGPTVAGGAVGGERRVLINRD
jgi:hypothetical protein